MNANRFFQFFFVLDLFYFHISTDVHPKCFRVLADVSLSSLLVVNCARDHYFNIGGSHGEGGEIALKIAKTLASLLFNTLIGSCFLAVSLHDLKHL